MPLREVTKEEFYAAMGPLNVHPCPEREVTNWKMHGGAGALVGKSYPGYLAQGAKRYFLSEK